MPELPEVEIVRCTLLPLVVGRTVKKVNFGEYNLRKPLPREIAKIVPDEKLLEIKRRGKYLLLKFARGVLVVHLGMTGSFCWSENVTPLAKHEHFSLDFCEGGSLRYRDPRRFGLLEWTKTDPNALPELANLGVEPLTEDFNAQYLFRRVQRSRLALKPFLMNNEIVVGIGNIYATEILFAAGIHPERLANSLTLTESKKIIIETKRILSTSIEYGGTTIRDYLNGLGKIGSYQNKLRVYGHAGEKCPRCQTTLIGIKQSQRSTVYCPKCQK